METEKITDHGKDNTAVPLETELVKPIQGTAEEHYILDEAEIFLRDHNYTMERVDELLADKERLKKLRRKIDMIIMPLLAGTYVLQYIDKQAISYAAVFDLFTSTTITPTQYSWFPSIFYFAYLVAEYPWVYLVQRTRMAKVVSGCVFTWGSVLLITAACSGFPGFAACRFFLGIFEAPVTTCFMMTVAMWYVRSEQPLRAGIFYCCNGFGSMLGGIFSYGMGKIDNFPVWKSVFLVCGALTVVWGFVLFFYLPDSLISAKQFTVEEKAILIGRARQARTGVLNKKIKWYQIREALLDPQVWLLTLFVLFNETINGGLANFGKLIVKGFVHDALRTTALGIPQGAFQVFWILTGTLMASKIKNFRTIVMAMYVVPTMIAVCLMFKLPRDGTQKTGLLLSYYICGSYVASLVLALQMPSSNLGGYTKRITGSAIVFMAYCVGNVIGPHAFLAEESPTYKTGTKVCLSCAAAQFVLAISLRILLIRRNKKRDAAAAEIGLQVEAEDTDLVDLTDYENPHFRYVL